MKTKRLPFTDENLEREAYSDECDRLAELEIPEYSTSWGRWFLEDGMICTYIILPKGVKNPVKRCDVYSFAVEKCLTQEQQIERLNEVAELDFVGSSGIKSLAKAFKYLSRKNKVEDSGEGLE